MDIQQEITPDQIREFVIAGHGDLPKVKAMLAGQPALLNAAWDWGGGDLETALLAASHVGNREVAEYLLSQGAPLHVCAAAMLGRRDRVAEMVQADPALVNARGAHGITLMFHTALSGDTALADWLLSRGSNEGISHALHAAVGSGHLEMVRWLLAHGADTTVKNFQDKTPLQAAAERGYSEIAEALRQNGARE
jgi:ankyrin repeat protein